MKPLTDEDLLERAAVDGRVAFGAAAFGLAAGLIALLDRVGAPGRLVGVLGPAMALAGLATIGLLVRTMRVSRFYAAGRAAPPAYAGLAFASLAAALFAPFAPPAEGGVAFARLIIGFAGGMVVAALVSGPLMRKSGAFSAPDLVAGRFPNLALRLGVVAVVAAIGLLIALAGYEMAVAALVAQTGAGRGLAIVLVGLVLALIVAPGGVSGVVWSATGAAGILLAGLCLPLTVLMWNGVTPPAPVLGDADAWSAALARMVAWNGEGSGHDPGGVGLILAVMLGLGALAPLLVPAMATRDGAEARQAGLTGLSWCVVLAALAAITMAAATLAFDQTLVGMRPELTPPSILAASAHGVVSICGGHPATAAAARALCGAIPGFGGVLRTSDVAADGQYLLVGLSNLHGLGGALSGIAAGGAIAAALALAASGAQAFATALGHDAFYRVRDTSALTSRRLAVARLLMVIAIVAGAVVLSRHAPDPRGLIGLAIVFCVSSVAPLLILSLWPRAEGVDATAALLLGLATAETMILLTGGSPTLDGFAHAGLAACVVSVATGIGASLLHRADPTSPGGAFVHGMLHGESDALNPDKGA